MVALKTAVMLSNPALDKILDELSKTERNFILKKGETTMELERMKNDKNEMKELLKDLTNLIKRISVDIF